MKRNLLSRVLGVLGLVVLLSTFVTFLFGNTHFVVAKAALGLLGIAAGFALGESGGLKRFFTGRALHFGFFTAVSAALVLTLLAAVNYVAYKKPRTWDLTKNRIFTLSEDTVRTLQGLSTDVKVLAFLREDEPGYAEAADLLRRYGDRSPRFRHEFVDPYRNPEVVKQHGITDLGPRVVVTAGQEQVKVKELSEQGLTSALVQATRTVRRKVYFTKGHGEPEPREPAAGGLSQVVQALEGEGVEVAGLSLLDQAEVPADAAAVLVVSPRKPLLAHELEALEKYAARGGQLGVFLEPEVESGLEPLLARWGVEPDDTIVVDPNPMARLFGGSPVTPVVQASAQHEATRDLANVGVAFPTTRSLVALSQAEVHPVPLALAGESAWAETDVKGLFSKGAEQDEGEKGGPLPVMMAATRTFPAEQGAATASRLVAAGDGEFFTNRYQHLLGNADLFLNAVNWLAAQEDRLTIRPRQREASRLYLTEAQATALKFATIDALPVALLGLGLAVWLVRRSK
jgi:ABC-type uncharacterized transport system involved in gliding motility auxiliary subunit